MRYRSLALLWVSVCLPMGTGCSAPSRGAMAPMAAYEAAPSYRNAEVAGAAAPGSEKAYAEQDAAVRPSPAAPMPQGGSKPTAAPRNGKQSPSDKPSSVEEAPSTPILIYTGVLALLVAPDTFASTIDAAIEVGSKLGGFVGRHDDRTVTLRVPSARFREAMRELEKLGVVQSRNVEAEDVSEEFHDLDVRLQSLRATRKRLEEMLQKTANIHDVLEVEEQLARVTAEIDRIEGRMRFLSSHASMSTITVTLAPKTPSTLNVIAPPPPRTIPLPIEWLSSLGVDRLLELSR